MDLPPGFTLDTDRARLDRDTVHRFLSQDSYWARDIPREVMDRSIDNSLCFAITAPGGALAAFGRVISDCATFAYVGDVFVLPPWRGLGLSKALMAAMRAHPSLQGLRRWLLVTRDAHALYAGFGFAPLANPERFMAAIRAGGYPPLDSAGPDAHLPR